MSSPAAKLLVRFGLFIAVTALPFGTISSLLCASAAAVSPATPAVPRVVPRDAAPVATTRNVTILPWPRDEFCGRAQAFLAATTVRVANTIHDSLESFRRAPPTVDPLTTQQYLRREERGPPGATRSIACKLLLAERVVAAHGAGSAGRQTQCERANRYTLDAVRAGFTDAERERARFRDARNVRIDRDEPAASEAQWYEPFDVARIDASGRLHLRASTLRRDWSPPAWPTAPGADEVAANMTETGGTLYCELIAPEYLRRVLLGESEAPGPAAASPASKATRSPRTGP